MIASERVTHGEVVRVLSPTDADLPGLEGMGLLLFRKTHGPDMGSPVPIALDGGLIPDAVCVRRPAGSEAHSDGTLFRLEPGSKYAQRVHVRYGSTTGSLIQIVKGLKNGERVIVSDMSRWAGYSRLRLGHERPPRDR